MTKAYILFTLSILLNEVDEVRLPGIISMPKINIRNDDTFLEIQFSIVSIQIIIAEEETAKIIFFDFLQNLYS